MRHFGLLGALARHLKLTGLLIAVALVSIPAPVFAQYGLSPEQKKIFGNHVLLYNHEVEEANGACSQGRGGPANLTVGPNFSLGDINDPATRQVNLMKALIADYQLTPEQAAGIIGNFMHESGGEHLPPDINEGDTTGAPPKFSGGYGWAQWTGPRQDAFIRGFAIPNGYMASEQDLATDAANYGFLKDELSKAYSSTIPGVKATTTVAAAATAFEDTYESAGTPNMPSRIEKAEKALAAFNGGGAVATPGSGAGSGGGAGCGGAGGAAIVGDNAFPLIINKGGIDNNEIFANGTTVGGHNYPDGRPIYIAYDILVPTGTEVVAFLQGTVTRIGNDRCGGRLISVYNQPSDLLISYMHLNTDESTHVAEGDTVDPGQHIGLVGTLADGCVVPHLHIDAIRGQTRVPCSRNGCTAENSALFTDIGPQLYTTYQELPE